MFDRFDGPFKEMCFHIKPMVNPTPSDMKKFFTYSGFINFYDGNDLYVIFDCEFARKYLEMKGFTAVPYGQLPSTGHFIQYNNEHVLDDMLKKEGPSSKKIRKLYSWLIASIRDNLWDKLDRKCKNIDSIFEMQKMASDFYMGHTCLNPNKDKEFLRTGWGRYAILRYALLCGHNYFDEVEEELVTNYNCTRSEVEVSFERALTRMPFEYFEAILSEVENKKKGSR